MKPVILALALVAASTSLTAGPVKSYPIDCAILLCLAGGFPSSAECTAAKVEMIRRITPFPVEPPLQLWNCPMTLPANLLAELSLPPPDVGPDGLTPDVRAYRDGIEIYHISQYRRWQSHGDVNVIDNTSRGVYGTDGRFSWVPSSYERGPAWLAEVAGGRTISIQTCTRVSGAQCASSGPSSRPDVARTRDQRRCLERGGHCHGPDQGRRQRLDHRRQSVAPDYPHSQARRGTPRVLPSRSLRPIEPRWQPDRSSGQVSAMSLPKECIQWGTRSAIRPAHSREKCRIEPSAKQRARKSAAAATAGGPPSRCNARPALSSSAYAAELAIFRSS